MQDQHGTSDNNPDYRQQGGNPKGATLAKKSPAVTSAPGFHVFPFSTLRKNEWIPSVSLSLSIYRDEEAAGRRNDFTPPDEDPYPYEENDSTSIVDSIRLR